MLLLDELTEQIGPLEWPTYVLQYLFLDRPKPTRASRLRKFVILLWKQCTTQDGVYLLRRVLRVYGSYGPFRGGPDPGVVLRMVLFRQ